MTFDLPLRSPVSRLLLGGISLLAFAFFAFHIENTFFADYLGRIPLFGTERAALVQPRDPQYEFQLGVYWMVANHPEFSVPYLERATQLDPYDGRAWSQLASAYQQIGDLQQAGYAIDRCLLVDPTTPELLWQAANLNVVLGERDKAMDAIRRFVTSSPERVPIASQLAWRATRDAKFLLDTVLPRNANSDLALLISLIRMVDPEASAQVRLFDDDPKNYFVHNLAVSGTPSETSRPNSTATAFDLRAAQEKARVDMRRLIEQKTGRDFGKTQRELETERKQQIEQAFDTSQAGKKKRLAENEDIYAGAALAWQHLMADSEGFDIRLAFPYVQLLIDSNQEDAAVNAWNMLTARQTRLKSWSVAGNLIKNPSFENEILNGGFDWQYTVSDDDALGIDHTDAKVGSASLLIQFKNSRAPDAGVVQYVPVHPDTDYAFTGYVKTDSIQTVSGPRLVVKDVDAQDPYFESDDFRRNVYWTQVHGQFRTRPTAHFVTIRVVRNSPGTLISGNVRIDGLSLSPVASAEPSASGGN